MTVTETEYRVCTAGLDAVDFTAAGILGALGRRTQAIIDHTDIRGGPEVDELDPRLAIPIPGSYAAGPDGSLRQRVVSAKKLVQSGAAAVTPPLSDNLSASLAGLLHRATMLKAPPDVAFMTACYERLGVKCVTVSGRPSRQLTPFQRQSLVDRLRQAASSLPTSEHLVFRQGGYVLLDGKRMDRLWRAPSGEARIGQPISGGTGLDHVLTAASVELHGPLDALALADSQDSILGHIPWFLEAATNPPEGEFRAVEVVRSIFLKYPANRPWAFDSGPTGILVDEYPDVALTALRKAGIFAPDWLFSAARWLGSKFQRSDERWAWSQASASAAVHELRRGPAECPVSELQIAFAPAFLSEKKARAQFANEPEGREISLEQLHWALEAGIDWADDLLQRFNFPRTFHGSSSENVDSLRLKNSGEIASSSSIRAPLSEYRHLAWELTKIVVSAIMLYADTTLRASLPILSITLHRSDFADYIETHRAEFEHRAALKSAIRWL